MKFAEYNIEKNNVEVFNTILGVESVNLNGKEMSTGFSWFGKDHSFRIGADNYLIKPQISFRHRALVEIRVYKNGMHIVPENLISKSDKSMLVVRMISSLFLGVAFGLAIVTTADFTFDLILPYIGF